ncbi:MAG: hypothetical protein QOJ00_163 [Actinomycetota bacterium]|jgi:GAF domain-containing protein
MVVYPDDFVRNLQELSRVMVDEESLDNTLQRVATLATASVDGCSLASVTLEGESKRTAASTDPIALELDVAQYEVDDGPCLHALRTKTVVGVPSMGEEQRWTHFVRCAREHQVFSSLSLPLVVQDVGRGALNLYGRVPAAFPPEDENRALLLAQLAAVAIANSEVYWRTFALTQNLRAALESRDVIGQAKGILMAQHGITADEAFTRLRHASQRHNQKLRAIADIVAFTGDLPPDEA